MRLFPIGAALLALSLAASGARAQVSGLPQLPGVQAAQAANEGSSFGADAAAAPTATRTAADTSALVGLKEPAQREVLTLPQALDALGADNPDLQISAERLVQANAGVRRAWALLLPQLSLSGSYVHNCTAGGADGVNCADRTTQFADPDQVEQQADLFEGIADVLDVAADTSSDPDTVERLRNDAADLRNGADDIRKTNTDPIVVQPASVFSGALTFSLPIFNARSFPVLWNAYSAVDLADAARAQVRAAMTFSLVRAYLAAVTARKLADVAQQQVAQNERHLAATQARVEAQTQPPLAQKRAQLELLRAKSSLTSARASYDTAIATLGLVLGRDEAFDVATDAQALPVPPAGTPDELAQKAIEARPDLVVQRKALEIAERQVTDGWMQFLPSVNLIARASASSFTSGFVKDPINGTLTISAIVPLYDGGNRYAALRDAHSKVREESIRLRQLEERVRAQVRGNARDIETKAQSLAIAKESAEIARVAVEQANAMFDAGVGTSLDVSDTQLRLFLAETELLRAEQDLAIARAGLAYVSGVPLYESAP